PEDPAIPLLGIYPEDVPTGNSAQSVDQPDAHVTLSEGASLELRCSYSYSAAPYLFWYVQYPGQSLQFLLKYITGDAVVKGTKGFEAEFRKSNSSFNLKKSPAHWSDSAKYFCALNGLGSLNPTFSKGSQML
uniref:Ig-like domain-containing protein n=1 Tax=Mus spicilegus TaxID=10103 RepID=A0A8C6IAL5_MUSSI